MLSFAGSAEFSSNSNVMLNFPPERYKREISLAYPGNSSHPGKRSSRHQYLRLRLVVMGFWMELTVQRDTRMITA